MKKQKLLSLLENYKSDYVDEIKFKKQIIDFIKNNDNIFGKINNNGHITGSSWIISKDKKKALLTHHNKLDRWFQLGGHTEENEDILSASLREAKEESGLDSIKLLSEDIFDIDVHTIPQNKKDKEHIHYDIRFLFESDIDEQMKISNESKDLKWIDLKDIKLFTDSRSISRMVEKTYKL